MATLVLGYAGAAIGGYVGGPPGAIAGQIIGGAIGGYIDRAYVFPAIFGTGDPIQGPRLADLSVSTATEGQPMFWCMGPINRVTGQYIHLYDLIEEESEEDVGGKGGGGGPTVKNYAYFMNAAISFVDCRRLTGIFAIKTIWADAKVIYDAGQKDARLGDLRIYLGDDAQLPDTLLESYEGTGEVPAYRGTAYIVIERMALRDWGNRPPAIRALIVDEEEKTVASAISDLCVLAGLSEDDIDVSGVPGCLCGYTIDGPQEIAALIEVLMMKEQLNVAEDNGVLRFYAKGDEPLLPVVFEKMAAHEQGTDAPRNMTVGDADELRLPSEVNVQYQDIHNENLQGSERARNLDFSVDQPVQINLPIVIGGDEARALSETVLWASWAERQTIEAQLPPSYRYLMEGNVIYFTDDDGETWYVRIEDFERGDNSLLKITGVTVQQHVYNRHGISDPTNAAQREDVYSPPDLTLILLNIAPLRSADVQIPGFYWAVCATNRDDTWLSAAIYQSTNDITYTLMSHVSFEATVGTATTVLGDGPIGYWDYVSEVTVTLRHGTLSSRTEDEVLDGFNHAMLGDEHIAFQTATLVSEGVYTISGLLRGLRNTEGHVATHAEDDLFVLLANPSIGFQPLEYMQVDSDRYYKAVPTYGIVDDFPETAFTPTGQTMKQFSPVDITGVRDGSNNLTITWTRRSRGIVNIFGEDPVPLYSSTEAYEIDILDGSDVVRTIEASSSTASYSAADQTLDGFTPGDPITLVIYQLTTDYGRGNPGEATI